MLLGVHCSTAGGLHNAFDEAAALGIDTMQIFTRNQKQWVGKPITAEEITLFHDAFKKSNVKIIFSHASYLVNLASSDDLIWENSISNMIAEVNRCHQLGLSFSVMHPGALKGQSEEDGVKRIAEALQEIFKATKNSEVKILLENVAGQGTHIGFRFSQLRAIMDAAGSIRTGICFDTCHAFASGYDIRNREGFEKTFTEFDEVIGLKHLHAIHLNDSKGDFGSRIDRHENIGKGKIGTAAFKMMLEKFPQLPKVLETDKEDDMDKINLEVLKKLVSE